MSKLILVIEDSKTIAMYESKTLKDAGYDVVVAHDFEEAKALIKFYKRQITLSIVDINLPKDKEKALDYLLKHNIPSIAMTGSFHQKLRDQVVDKNIIDYIVLEDDKELELLQSTVNRIFLNKNRKVLIVDDSAPSRYALKNLLNSQNFTILEAHDAMQALNLLKDHNDINIAIIDYEMPKMNGAELTRIIRQNYSRTEMAILAISVHSKPIVTIECLKAGANDFIIKPYVKEEVLARLSVNIDLLDQHVELQKEIQERKKIAKELKISQISAEKANQAKTNFLDNISHELKTPMNAIMGFTDLLKLKETQEDKLKKLNIIQESSKSLMDIIDDILEFSKIESGNLEINSSIFETIEPFENIAKIFKTKALEKNITIDLNLNENLPILANGDILRIKQILSNLLSNAIKFSKKESKIIIDVYANDKFNLVCSIEDFGIGISQENIINIFNVFEQVDNSSTRNYGGTGIGLSICKHLSELMNGNLHVESTLAKGSKFYFEIELFKDIDKEL